MRHDVSLKMIVAIVAITASITLHCADFGPVAGTVTQSGNGMVCGTVVDSGVPVSGVRVLLVPAQYDPVSSTSLPDSLFDTTGPSGTFRIKAPKSTAYNVQVENIMGKNALRCNVGFSDGDTQNIEPLALAIPGHINVIISDTASSDTSYVYIPGTTFFSRVHGDTTVIGNVPAGFIPSVNYRPSRTGPNDRVIKTDVVVTSGMTTTITDYLMWANFKRLYLNTTPSGADITGNVMNFPALVRLTSNNFDFSQARSGGEDIRFMKKDGTPLPFEIERWDAAGQAAEIWVKVDTVYANDSTQNIIMRWGNTIAVSASDGAAVFDTADGFQGVWHLGEFSNSLAKDATGNHFDGTPSDTAPLQAQGVIGSALQFNGKSNGLIMKNTAKSSLNFPRPGTYTFSAWVSVDSGYTDDEFIAGKGINQPALRIKGSQSIPSNMFALQEYYDAPVNGTDMRCSPVVTQRWKYVVGIRDSIRSCLFIDGTCVDSTGTLYPVKSDYKDTVDFSIGRCVPSDVIRLLPFKGKIDEVRISGVALSADWVKLSFMNQQPGDKLIQWTK
jgi:hypothetical protein